MSVLQTQSYLAPAYAPKPEREESWHKQALCAQTNTEIFFPDVGIEPKMALMICADCPVMYECRAECDRLETGKNSTSTVFGVWGGETVSQRISRRRRARERAGLRKDGRKFSPTTPFRCERCKRMVRPKNSTEKDFPGTVSAWGSRMCSTCGRNRKIYG